MEKTAAGGEDVHEGKPIAIGDSTADLYQCGTSFAVPEIARRVASLISKASNSNSPGTRSYEETLAEYIKIRNKLRELVASGEDADLWLSPGESNSNPVPGFFCGSGGLSSNLLDVEHKRSDGPEYLVFDVPSPLSDQDSYDFFLDLLAKAKQYRASRRAQLSCLSFTEEVEKLVRKLQRCFGVLLSGLRPVTTEDAGRRHWIASPIAPRIVLPRSFSDSLA